ncbi:MAG: TlpA disulfide reductase family protein [Actinomycetota bacterium]|nr:TlpA disulfide reductase family protein [Actinomycetota bacterium]MDA8075731.1 TlpA disulfide reductase family protein [Actinomycetota bacterium]MDA8368184.1 TlpA disulfide reductase family protein [Actinomycetota bacterium]
MAPNGTFTTPRGTSTTIASLRGKPTMVWFVAGGCASCAASIPAVAQQLGQLSSDGVQVVTLGLYGAFSTGKQGVAQLLSFGRAAAGTTITRPGWTWGLASEALSEAYDPSGAPDIYALIGPDGRIRYQNSVPVSTMPQLLAAVGRLTGHRPSTGHQDGHTKTTGATLP